jgi:spore maturation protein CgeB
MNILVAYRAIPGSPGWATGDYVVKALNKLGHNATPYARMYKSGIPIAKLPHSVDLLLYLECNDPDPQYMELMALQCPKIYWEFDTVMHTKFTKDWLRAWRFDRIFFANPVAVKAVKGSHYLPYAADIDNFYSSGMATDRPKFIGMVGHDFGPRAEFCKEVNIELISNVYRKAYSSTLRDFTINVHNHASGGNGLLVMRIWEVLASGSLLFTENDNTLLQHFIPGEHLVTYGGIEDFNDKLEWLAINPNEIDRIALNGYNLLKNKHTYEHRCKMLLEGL